MPDNANTVRRKALDLVYDIRYSLAENHEPIEQLRENGKEINSEDEMVATARLHRFNIGDAATVIRVLVSSSKKIEKPYTKKNIENSAAIRVGKVVEDYIKKGLAAFLNHPDGRHCAAERTGPKQTTNKHFSKKR